jgi:hypothetical protein
MKGLPPWTKPRSYISYHGPDKALSPLFLLLGHAGALQRGLQRSNNLYGELPRCPRDKNPLPNTDLVRVFDPVDPGQLLISDIIGLPDTKQVFATFDHMIDPLLTPVRWNG